MENNNTEKIKFIGYNAMNEYSERTVTGIYDRETIDRTMTLTNMDKLKYNFICSDTPLETGHNYLFKYITLSLLTDGVFHNMIILLKGVAYVMDCKGDTIDSIKSKK